MRLYWHGQRHNAWVGWNRNGLFAGAGCFPPVIKASDWIGLFITRKSGVLITVTRKKGDVMKEFEELNEAQENLRRVKGKFYHHTLQLTETLDKSKAEEKGIRMTDLRVYEGYDGEFEQWSSPKRLWEHQQAFSDYVRSIIEEFDDDDD